MKIIHKNKKEDIKLLIDLGADYQGEDIVLTFSAGQYGLNKFVCSYVGGVQTNCVVNNSTVLCLLDNHGLSLGMLSVEIDIRVPDSQMPDGDFRHVTQKIASFVLGGEECSLELTNGASDYFPEEVVPESVINLLPTVIKGEPGKDADIEGCNKAIAAMVALTTEVEMSESKRAEAEHRRMDSEAKRIAAENERKTAETQRADAETERQQAENIRKQKESERQEAEQERITNNEKCVTAINTALSAAQEATTAANNATTDATNAAGEANAAAERANEAADLVYNGPEEVVSVALYSAVEGVSTSGLELYVYINDNSVPLIYTTNENGMATFRVTKGLRYDIVFPDITGCAPIGRLSYTAALQTRGIEVTYHEAIVAAQEKVTISFMKFPENTTWNGGEAYPDGVARVTIDGIETVYNADSNGQAQFLVPIGKEYRVSIDKPADLHLITGAYSATYTADRAARVILVSFHPYLSDILIVDKDGGEWTYDGFIASGRDVSEGVLLHIATEELLAVGCDFFMSVDVMAYRKFDTDKTEIRTMSWAAQDVQFTSIPLDGNDVSQEYYYDGFTATNLIVQEGLSRGLVTDCHTRTLRETYALGVTTLQGFTPSTGQYAPLIANYTYINDIVTFLRPDGDVVNKFWNFNKGTSTQQSATGAYSVGSYVKPDFKNRGAIYAPVCAYAKPTL